MRTIGRFTPSGYTTLHMEPSHNSAACGETRPPEIGDVYEIIQNSEGVWYRLCESDTIPMWASEDDGTFSQ